jgi:hypothetical protein
LRKRYRGFHVQLVEEPVAGPGTRRRKKL